MMEECSSDVDLSPAHPPTVTPKIGRQEENAPDSRFQSLFEKYSIQQKELERVEEQNEEYREKLLKTIRERDLNDELLKNIREENKKETEELRRKVKEYEIQLKAVQDRATAQEAHYNVTMKELSLKYNTSVGQLTKKADHAEKEKNEAVIKYATREAEIMRVRADMQRKDQELREAKSVRAELEKCQSQENVEQLEKSVNSLRVDLEKLKNENFDLTNRLKMSDKRVDAGQTLLSELKQQCEVLRKQLIQVKEEKSQLQAENRELSAKTQVQESRILQESDSMSKSHHELERRLQDSAQETMRYREENRALNERNELIERENLELLSKLQDLESNLQDEEEEHEKAKTELRRLSNIESQVKRSLEVAEKAKDSQAAAEKDRDIAETESAECRLQAERMLQITEQLTERNSQLAGEAEQIREKNRGLERELVETQGALSRAESKLADRERDLSDAQGCSNSETSLLKEELKGKIEEVQELKQQLQEHKNDYSAYKRKQTANIKELKHELSSLRRQLESGQSELVIPTVSTVPSMTSRSRTSSFTSLDRVTSCSQEESSVAKTSDDQASTTMQQAMIDKIVLLQRKLARRTEKIEFLEEHVKQSLEELQKKTKIIQHYALREEASLLLPADSSMEQLFNSCEFVQVPTLRKGSSYALMGSMFLGGGEKKSLQLVTEINSRLQAVLEDTLMKNITLKTSVDSLGNEITRLSRENRLLTLTANKNTFET